MTEMVTSRDDVSTTAANDVARDLNDSYDSYNYYYYDYDAGELRFYYALWTIATPIVFALITVVGVVGNLVVVAVIVTRRSRRRSPTNVLLLNLAVADLAFLVVCVPFTGVKYAATSWPLGDTACRVGNYLLHVVTLKLRGSAAVTSSPDTRDILARMSRVSGDFPVQLTTRLADWTAGGLQRCTAPPVCPRVASFSKFHEPVTHDQLRTSSQGCHEDATRKPHPWNFSFTQRDVTVTYHLPALRDRLRHGVHARRRVGAALRRRRLLYQPRRGRRSSSAPGRRHVRRHLGRVDVTRRAGRPSSGSCRWSATVRRTARSR